MSRFSELTDAKVQGVIVSMPLRKFQQRHYLDYRAMSLGLGSILIYGSNYQLATSTKFAGSARRASSAITPS